LGTFSALFEFKETKKCFVDLTIHGSPSEKLNTSQISFVLTYYSDWFLTSALFFLSVGQNPNKFWEEEHLV
jgi:hypothetical protein